MPPPVAYIMYESDKNMYFDYVDDGTLSIIRRDAYMYWEGKDVADPSITIDEIAEKLGVNEKTIRRDLKELRDNNIIIREGGNYGGHWVILK